MRVVSWVVREGVWAWGVMGGLSLGGCVRLDTGLRRKHQGDGLLHNGAFSVRSWVIYRMQRAGFYAIFIAANYRCRTSRNVTFYC